MKKSILLTLLTLILSGCSWVKNNICDCEVNVVNEKPALNLETLTPVSLNELQYGFKIITENDVKYIFEDLKQKNIDPVFFAMTDNDYETFSLNLKKLMNFITLQSEQIKIYKNYYEKEKQTKKEISTNKNEK